MKSRPALKQPSHEVGSGPVEDPRAAQILEKLQEEGGRVTRTRRMILDVMLSSGDHHLTAADVVEGVRQLDPSFPESTVYRTLARLEQIGVIEPLPPARSVTYHLSDEPHVHALCDRCGALFKHDPELLEPLASVLRDRHGFELDLHRTAMRGECRECRAAVDVDA